ncbi:MAG: hypothetical protein EB034_18185 [Verrucomicrobia bacterium]|nr:hypothetical protein [Verrucomicrobiota bacterium]
MCHSGKIITPGKEHWGNCGFGMAARALEPLTAEAELATLRAPLEQKQAARTASSDWEAEHAAISMQAHPERIEHVADAVTLAVLQEVERRVEGRSMLHSHIGPLHEIGRTVPVTPKAVMRRATLVF